MTGGGLVDDIIEFDDKRQHYEIVLDAQHWKYLVFKKVGRSKTLIDQGPMPPLKWYTPKVKK